MRNTWNYQQSTNPLGHYAKKKSKNQEKENTIKFPSLDKHEEKVNQKLLFDESTYISVYTREMAIEDGQLVDLNQYVSIDESGFKCPVACTRAVWTIIDKVVKNKKHWNDYEGVIWDIFTMIKWYSKAKRNSDTILFKVKITGAGRKQNYIFKAMVHGGDRGEMVMTILLLDED